MKAKSEKSAFELHKKVPPNWYYQSLKVDPFQKFWHKRRFEEVTKVLEKVNGEVLDMGCADGMFSKVILDGTGAKKLIGIDVLKSSVNWANKHWKKQIKMTFKVGDAHNLKYKNNTFSAVFAMEVLEHVHEPVKVFKEVKRILKKGGYAVFLVPSDSNLFQIVWFLWLHFYPRGWVWKETHIQTYRNNELPKMCKKAGFRIEIDRKFNLGMLHLVKVRKV
ncbi:MAG: Methyltransferase type 11 [Candidatus Woesebacteria bacterium GW2011_GWC1_38_13]|uniref:Methyltransferase type 11 n=3 Tax=Candidatus Woeseibacteriota TaxID=1752722 RepID=A0A0G0L6L0_9BACT|nr:MAG: Methyltransferase type 11 [Candidatus Woesebacteria bacterium GW2011_GWD1_38_10]KKQ55214.1 MAG: Methyltransferase type 11 [Candidatus Woesebacteria bacterium GW2011_GWC1_38_13]KKQ83495.1 MAG: Methyltransferase type 11 [Candidatus Woesebacteria bacterium GW2011_GWA1_38_8]